MAHGQPDAFALVFAACMQGVAARLSSTRGHFSITSFEVAERSSPRHTVPFLILITSRNLATKSTRTCSLRAQGLRESASALSVSALGVRLALGELADDEFTSTTWDRRSGRTSFWLPDLLTRPPPGFFVETPVLDCLLATPCNPKGSSRRFDKPCRHRRASEGASPADNRSIEVAKLSPTVSKVHRQMGWPASSPTRQASGLQRSPRAGFPLVTEADVRERLHASARDPQRLHAQPAAKRARWRLGTGPGIRPWRRLA